MALSVAQIIRFLEICGHFNATWPAGPEVRGRKLWLRNLYSVFVVVNMLTMLIIPVGLCVMYCQAGIGVTMKALSELAAVFETMFDVILCRLSNKELHILVSKIKKFVRTAPEDDLAILQGYIDGSFPIYAAITAAFFGCATTFIMAPLFLGADLMCDVWLPFPVEGLLLKKTIYVFQAFAAYETASVCTGDFLISLFLWFTTAKLDILAMDLSRVKDDQELRLCIKKHQEIIEFVDETENCFRRRLFKCNISLTLIVVFGALALMQTQSPDVLFQFVTMVFAGMIRLYGNAWPATALRERSENLAWSIYSLPWLGWPKSTAQNVYLMIQRSQKPLTVSAYFLPPLSLQFYMSFLKAMWSYFMAIRTLILG